MTLINTDCVQQHMHFAASKALTANSCGTYTHLVLLAVQFLPVTMLSVVPTSDADVIYTQSRTPDPNTRAREKSCSKLWNVARPIRSLSFSSAFRHALNYYYYICTYVRLQEFSHFSRDYETLIYVVTLTKLNSAGTTQCTRCYQTLYSGIDNIIFL